MAEDQKHCNTCKFSYFAKEANAHSETGYDILQKCSNEKYNSGHYNKRMLISDWGKDHCRFWEPKL